MTSRALGTGLDYGTPCAAASAPVSFASRSSKHKSWDLIDDVTNRRCYSYSFGAKSTFPFFRYVRSSPPPPPSSPPRFDHRLAAKSAPQLPSLDYSRKLRNQRRRSDMEFLHAAAGEAMTIAAFGNTVFEDSRRGLTRKSSYGGSTPAAMFGFGRPSLPDIVMAGDPVLHERAKEVRPEDIGSPAVEKTINDMVAVMRNAPGVGLAAPQIGVPLRIIVLEDAKEYMRYNSKEELDLQERVAFDLLVIINPVLTKKGDATAAFFEGCLSVDKYRAMVERALEVSVKGLGRDGKPVHVMARGWQARILQHECDHLDGLLYVDRMVPRTFRTVENIHMPLASDCPRPGPCCRPVKSLAA